MTPDGSSDSSGNAPDAAADSGGAPVEAGLDAAVGCPFVGTYTLDGSDFTGAPPWLWMRNDGHHQCEAVVASEGRRARAYDVQQTATSVELTPQTEPAVSGVHEPITYEFTYWDRISIAVTDGALGPHAEADTTYDMYGEDIEDTMQFHTDLIVRPASSGIVTVPKPILPWRIADVQPSRPTLGIAQYLGLPSPQWTAHDRPSESEGIIAARLAFSGAWDDVRGKTLPLTILPGLVDLSGEPVAMTSVGV